MRGKGKWIWGGVVVAVCVVIGLAVQSGADDTNTRASADAGNAQPGSPSDGPDAATQPPTAAPGGSARPKATPKPPTAAKSGTALALLKTLPVKGRAPKTGYTRDRFGPAWADVDHNGCDTRNDILHRDLSHLTLRGSCIVASGILNDPYTATQIHFTRGVSTSTAVQIDHVVALSNAWQTGAQKLTAAQRQMIGNDPLNLLAVDGPTNEGKGDGDAATWLPPSKAFRCRYVATQISVKAAYRLWVTPSEKAAMGQVLSTCPTQPAYRDSMVGTSGAIPLPTKITPAKPAAPKSTAPKTSSTAYYANCTAVRAAGKAPLHRGEPGYRPALDRDGDGIACE